MADGRLSAEWDQTAELLAAIYNVLREKPLASKLFHPYRQERQKTEDHGAAWDHVMNLVLGGAFGG